MDKPNGKLTPIEWQMLIDDLVAQMPFQIKLYAESSKLFKARFDALVAAGFNAQQALEIVKARGVDI
ncbi:hypothetical protein POF51_13320 [Brevibacillus sp. AG]|uniref:hypothetical protein n=1 Tax=Brevibacillus sp. AG TaxID=3020891 RepID=UPI00232FBB3F|nr:hypothetical protein [Brevibacillus sp. AG]MDC0761680.1 hypothetical protein [Brevibacillus sp. AG]